MNWKTWYITALIKYPYVVLAIVSILSCVCLIVPFTMKNVHLPNFQDPELGFATRNTLISDRLVTWENLQREIRPSGNLAKDPKDFLIAHHYINVTRQITKPYLKRRGGRRKNTHLEGINSNDIQSEEDEKNKTVYGTVRISEVTPGGTVDNIDKWRDLQNLTDYHPLGQISYEKSFCGLPDSKYVHLVVAAGSSDSNLLTWERLQTLCKLEHYIMNSKVVEDICISNTQEKGHCCRPWSIPNYIAAFYKKHSCLSVTEENVNKTIILLQECGKYFYQNLLNENCIGRKNCDVPLQCIKHDAVFVILKYLSSNSFFTPNNLSGKLQNLQETVLFLPVSTGVGSLPLYRRVEKLGSEFEGLSIVAMDFDIKTLIFDEMLLRDTRLMILGTAFVFICVWIYTTSIFLTVMTIISIFFVVILTYFLYEVAYGIPFFPFMNILTVVICIGIGADNSFILCKFWNLNKNHPSNNKDISKLMTATFHHALKSLFVTSLTTAVAFWGSFTSSVMAICCFSIFAGTAIIINFLLTIVWFPACLAIWEQSCLTGNRPYYEAFSKMICFLRARFSRLCCKKCVSNWNGMESCVMEAVVKLRYFWIFGFTTLAALSSYVAFVNPGLRLPTSMEFQLLLSSHPFEMYDFVYKQKFLFNQEKAEININELRMPLRFVWGVRPVDNGNHLDPANFGTLELDPNFDVADPESQLWLSNFCKSIRQQPFYQPAVGISLTGCFIETFTTSMERRCFDGFSKSDKSPCCNKSVFPYNRTTFNKCITQEMIEIHEGPPQYIYPKTAGVFFSKERNPVVKVVVLEFDSNVSFSLSFKEIDRFYKEVNEWTELELSKAPSHMRNGFFVSELNFYDLQRELTTGTKLSIFVSMILASVVLVLSTLNPVLTFLSVVTISFSIITTIAGLVLFGWSLNILESVAISTSIGLSVDFSLHYCVNYKLCPAEIGKNSKDATRYALSCLMGPSFFAGLTTAGAGFFMLFSQVLPYFQIGLFLVLIMAVSWCYATFFLGALLYIIGPTKGCLDYSCLGWRHKLFPHNGNTVEFGKNEAVASTSSCTDLEKVSFITHSSSAGTKKKSSYEEPFVKYTPHHSQLPNQSPISNVTILMNDERIID